MLPALDISRIVEQAPGPVTHLYLHGFFGDWPSSAEQYADS